MAGAQVLGPEALDVALANDHDVRTLPAYAVTR
jgi:hypothetical protein